METIIVFGIVAIAFFLAGHSMYKSLAGKKGSCGCECGGACNHSNDCVENNAGKPMKGTYKKTK